MTLAERACVVAVLAVTGAAALGPPAHAQSAGAEVLFRDGRNLIKHGKLAAGCDKLVASERLESSVGTLLNVGDCREKLGMLASAWAAFRKAEAMAKRAGGDDKRQAEAGRRAALLERRLPNLVVEVPRRLDGLIVRRNAEVVDEAQWSMALPVDPGSYTIVAEAPGYRAWQMTVRVAPGDGEARRQVVTVPVLERIPVAPSPEPVASGVAPVPAPALVLRRTGTWSTTRKLSLAVALAGAGALGTGVYFGVRANDLRDTADRRCPQVLCADPEGLRLNDQAQISARRANLLYLGGGAVLATAVVMWLFGKPDETIVAPSAGDHRFGVAMAGSF